MSNLGEVRPEFVTVVVCFFTLAFAAAICGVFGWIIMRRNTFEVRAELS